MTQAVFIIIGYIIFVIYYFLMSTCHYCLSSLFTVQVYYYAQFVCLFVCLFVCSFVCLLILFLSFCLSTFTYLFIQLFICLFACLFVCLFVTINFMLHIFWYLNPKQHWRNQISWKRINCVPRTVGSRNNSPQQRTAGVEINGCFIQRNCRMGGQV